MFGFINIYKPYGMTSHDVINKLRRILGIKKIGHGGTLDPLAEGVLPVAAGGATRLIDFLPTEKEYIANFKLGFISKSYDTETELEKYSAKIVCAKNIEEILNSFKGTIVQKPPIYSAVKVSGKKLYQIAREGETIDVPEREITVKRIEITEFDESTQTGKILINCSKGTYIRSIINDIGQKLRTGAVMSGLIRTKSGGMNIDTSIRFEEISDIKTAEKFIIPVSEILPFQEITINDREYEKVKNGNEIHKELENGYLFLKYNEKILALGEAIDNIIKIRKVFI